MIQLLKRRLRRSGLRERLLANGQTKWLDIGSQRFDDGFVCLDVEDLQENAPRERFIHADILRLTGEDIAALGTFDLVRMQHFLEHFDFAAGQMVLKTAARLLRPGGYLLVSVPDLRKHLVGYVSAYRVLMSSYPQFAHGGGVPADAPPSLIFSAFTHQFGRHKCCYDRAGLLYAVRSAGGFVDVRILSLWDRLAGIPFTHNRPRQDVCLLARRSAAGPAT